MFIVFNYGLVTLNFICFFLLLFLSHYEMISACNLCSGGTGTMVKCSHCGIAPPGSRVQVPPQVCVRVKFACSPSQSKNMQGRLIGITKLLIVIVCAYVPCDGLESHPVCNSPRAPNTPGIYFSPLVTLHMIIENEKQYHMKRG